ncbi:hypothetical protein LJC29_04275 [Bacteroides sp. OttesenSCG-928-N06]|nr:hypothetical protein [Bacteroides sp. OttesenSCG-928-N06]
MRIQLKEIQKSNPMYVIALFLSFICLSGCNQQKKSVAFPDYTFTVDTIYPATPARSQGRSSNCWAYAVTSLFETEAMMAGDTVYLSPEYIVRYKYLMQFDRYCQTRGEEQICTGGLGHNAVNAFRRYGIVPLEEYDSYRQARPDYRHLIKSIRRLARKAVKNEPDKKYFQHELVSLLNARMGMAPRSFSFRNKTFTPHTFAAQLPAHNNEYIELTSFSNHPYHTYCELNVPDNWEHQPFYNLPLNQWIDTMVNALRQGYTFAWHGDVSEPGFSVWKGVAFCTPETIVNEDTRLAAFLSGETSDDHMMHIVGLAHNQHGERFFIAKNSYGEIGPFKGYVYLSEEYVRMKTLSILINKEFCNSNL